MKYGKYRALVTNIEDPEERGRIKVSCPKIYGDYDSAWCLPCIPYPFFESSIVEGENHEIDTPEEEEEEENTELETEIVRATPKIGDPIWIEFEEGDTNKPIWVGSWEVTI